MVGSGVLFRKPPGRGWNIHSNVYIGRGVVLDIQRNASLSIGKGTKIMQYVVVGAEKSVEIGDNCLVAEFTSVRDANHEVDTAELITHAPMSSRPVKIGSDVWLGRGVAVLAGANVENGAVLGANSLTNSRIPARAIAVGSPAKVIRYRKVSPVEKY